jgi:hypothetical protein
MGRRCVLGPQRLDRARDVLDPLLVDMLGQLDDTRTRIAAERNVAERATHAFPPTATFPAGWRRELGYGTTNAEEIKTKVATVLPAIAPASLT